MYIDANLSAGAKSTIHVSVQILFLISFYRKTSFKIAVILFYLT